MNKNFYQLYEILNGAFKIANGFWNQPLTGILVQSINVPFFSHNVLYFLETPKSANAIG